VGFTTAIDLLWDSLLKHCVEGLHIVEIQGLLEIGRHWLTPNMRYEGNVCSAEGGTLQFIDWPSVAGSSLEWDVAGGSGGAGGGNGSYGCESTEKKR